MKRQRITLVQTIGNLEDFYELRDKGALPLALKLYQSEIDILKIKILDHSPSSISVPYLYKTTERVDDEDRQQKYLTLRETSLEELIDDHRIYIPEFIDMEANRQYIDYILKTYRSAFENQDYANVLCTDYRNRILFRDKKRLFEGLGPNTDFVRGQYNENPKTKTLSDVLEETLKNTKKIEQNKEKIKALFY